MSGKKGISHYPDSLKEQIRKENEAGASIKGLGQKYGIGDRYSFCPNKLNSVTSVTHFRLGLSASKLRSSRFGAILPTS
ncbi:MAG: hypothetical protein PHD32_02270, partial [Eubacteriales bacterium]|nr:hypothetical protein [Eubacteriales bacterium]